MVRSLKPSIRDQCIGFYLFEVPVLLPTSSETIANTAEMNHRYQNRSHYTKVATTPT